MLDYPRPSSPASYAYALPPSPLPKRHHHSRRSHSPVPRIATLRPNHHGEYSPSSRAADISRLLDPAYSSHSSSSSAGSSSRAYVDHRGDLHDPDYRDFPVYPNQLLTAASRIRSTTTTTAAAATTTRKHRRTSGSSNRSQSRDRRYSASHYLVQPAWERAVESDEYDDDDDDDLSDRESQSHFSPFSSSSDPKSRHSACYSHYFGEHLPISSSPVSMHNNALQLESGSPLEDDAAQLRADEPNKLRRSSRRRSADSKPIDESSQFARTDDQLPVHSQPPPHPVPHIVHSGADYVPSCTTSLRRQWQTLSLRFRFGLFHAKQRLRRSLRH